MLRLRRRRRPDVTDGATLQRIDVLVLPPAWAEVWICPVASGHLQAIGVDAAGRRQYRYHDQWRRQRDLDKHERVVEFAAVLLFAVRRSAPSSAAAVWADSGCSTSVSSGSAASSTPR